MAEDTDKASQTEEATPRRLEEARRRGEVAKTPDLPHWASLAGAFGVMVVAGGFMMQKLAAALLPFITHAGDFSLQGTGGQLVMRQAVEAAMPPLLTVLGAAAIAGACGNLVQHGFLWSPDKLAPDFSRLSPAAGFKRLFGIDSFVQFLKTVLKVASVGVVCWYVLKPHASELANMANMEPTAILPLTATLIKAVFFAILTLLGVTAMVDWIWQRYRFALRMRMSREEVKDDYKQQEGDPHIKAKLRQQRIERAKRRMIQNVPKATVVVMNPTHYAVALLYEAGQTSAPKCVAKGLDAIALRIRAVAEEAGVPVIEDPPLARSLYAAVEVEDFIPQAHYEAVAKVIGFVMNGARRAAGQRARSLR